MASYAFKLPIEAREWLNRFSEEYVCANMNHSGEKIHKTKKQTKEIYDRNNARNRDIFTREKAQGTMNYLEELREKEEKELFVEEVEEVN